MYNVPTYYCFFDKLNTNGGECKMNISLMVSIYKADFSSKRVVQWKKSDM